MANRIGFGINGLPLTDRCVQSQVTSLFLQSQAFLVSQLELPDLIKINAGEEAASQDLTQRIACDSDARQKSGHRFSH